MQEESILWNQVELLEISHSSATSNGPHESPLDEYDGRYDYSASPTPDNLYAEEPRYFEEEAVESGPWTECGGKWAVVFDEDRQEYTQIRVPGSLEPESELSVSRVKPRAVCIDELD
ncbi:unnamed protein product [Phytophthora fragariaefolia]|uniref:Unnamed protein product n=1 Tax=Phytophthora fragariaefolia TaxID=1490495 RepID=A0A9W7CQN4_9STRA|nr:unnamed protein product [Phytophthora fragariaefolia]